MSRDLMNYDRLVEHALRGVVREALRRTQKEGLAGSHQFYVSFRTSHPGVQLADHLRAEYPEEMTIVLQHQFWGLEVGDDAFEVNLSFHGCPEKLSVPFAAVTAFADPSVEFGLQFKGQDAAPAESRPEQEDKGEAGPRSASETRAQEAAGGGGEDEAGDKVVTLDAFRVKK